MCGMIFMSSDPLIKVCQAASVSIQKLPKTTPDTYLWIYFKAPSKLTLMHKVNSYICFDFDDYDPGI